MGLGFGGEQEIAAACKRRLDDRLAGEEIVAEIDGPQLLDPLAMGGQPAFCGVAFAILVCRAVRFDDELWHQWQRHIVAGRTRVAASME